MCDYRIESQKTIGSLPVPFHQLRWHLGHEAHDELLRALKDGRARPGRDLRDGRALPPEALRQGHYYTAENFQKVLGQLAAKPTRCGWCGNKLPGHLVQEHLKPHNHREELRHHFHERCWQARLLALAAIFGHVAPEKFRFPSGPLRKPVRMPFCREETLFVKVRRIIAWRPKRAEGPISTLTNRAMTILPRIGGGHPLATRHIPWRVGKSRRRNQ